MTLPPFPGEGFLIHSPPNFEEEWREIIRHLLLATFFFIFLAPPFVKAYYNNKTHDRSTTESSPSENESLVDDAISSGKTNAKVRVVTRTVVNGQDQGTTTIHRKQTEKKIKSNSKKIHEEVKKTDPKEDKDAQVPGFVFPSINMVYLACLVILIANSPNNTTTARRVFLAPLLKPEETKMIIDMATNAAEHCARKAKDDLALIAVSSEEDAERKSKSLEKILEWPVGYKKDRSVSAH